MTGGEVAIELVRQSWVNVPLSDMERTQLRSVKHFSQRTPGLAMVCDGLDVSAAELSFLHSPIPPEECVLDVDAQAEYAERKQGMSTSSTLTLYPQHLGSRPSTLNPQP